MTTPVPTGRPGFGYGLGPTVIETPLGRLVGHNGSIPGFNGGSGIANMSAGMVPLTCADDDVGFLGSEKACRRHHRLALALAYVLKIFCMAVTPGRWMAEAGGVFGGAPRSGQRRCRTATVVDQPRPR